MKTSTSKSAQLAPKRSLPMPLWLQGAVELFFTALISLTAVVILLLAVWFAGGFAERGWLSSIGLGAQIWQLIHGVPLNLHIPTHGAFAAVSGTVTLMPLGLTLIPLLLCFRSGRRLAQASYEGQFWVPTVAGTITYLLISLVLSLVTSTLVTSTHPLLAAIIPSWVVLLGLIAGGWYESRSLTRMIGVNAAEWISRFSQYSRWAGSYIWTVICSSAVALLAFIGLGGLLLAITVFYNWNDVLALYQQLHAGAVGDTAITLLQAGFIPNFVIWAMAWSTGAGFSFGEGTIANLQVTDLGAMPALPILGALPVAVEPWSYLALLIPVTAGIVSGWWFFRAGENHYDEWLALKIRFRWVSWPLSTLCLAVFIGLLTGVWTALVGWLAHGSLGLGRFTAIGPNPLWLGLFTALWVAVGVVFGSILAPVLSRDTSLELERFSKLDSKQERKARKQRRAEEKAARKNSKKQEKLETPVIESAAVEETKDEADSAESKVVALLRRNSSGSVAVTESTEKSAEQPAEKSADEVAETRLVEDDSHETLAETATDSTQEAEPADPRKPKLSLGRVIRRPQKADVNRGNSED